MKKQGYNMRKIVVTFIITISAFFAIGIGVNNSFSNDNIDKTTIDLSSKSNSNEAIVKASNNESETFNNYLNEVMSKAAGKESSNVESGDSNTSLDVVEDTVAPIINEPTITGTISATGWYTSDVLIELNGVIDSSAVDVTIDKKLINYNTAGETVTITATDAAGNVTIKQIIVKVDKEAPIINDPVITGTVGNNGWYTTDITINHADASDNLSGVKETTIDKTSVSGNTAGETVIITSVDNAGNVSTYEQVIKIDTEKPVINKPTLEGNKGKNGWYTSSVTIVDNSATDNLSGLDKIEVDKELLSKDTNGETVTITAIDKAGNVSTYEEVIKIDTEAPTIEKLTIDGTMGNNGWYTTPVTITNNSSTDYMSGVQDTIMTVEGFDYIDHKDAKLSLNTSGETIKVNATDNAGNTSYFEETIKIDTIKPYLGSEVNLNSYIEKDSNDIEKAYTQLETAIFNEIVVGPSDIEKFSCDKNEFYNKLSSAQIATLNCTVIAGNGFSAHVSGTYTYSDSMLLSATEFKNYLASITLFSGVTEISFEHGISDEYNFLPTSERLNFGATSNSGSPIVGYIDGNVLRIQSDEKIYANFDSNSLFKNLDNITKLNLDNFYTYYINDYSEMFADMNNLTDIHFGDLTEKDYNNYGTSIFKVNLFTNSNNLANVTIDSEAEADRNNIVFPSGVNVEIVY